MKKTHFISVKKMQEIDKNAVKYGIPIENMMENAGKSMAFHIKNKFPDIHTKIVCVAGKGNNGGGVISAARHLTCYKRKVTLILMDSKLSTASKFHFSLLRKNKAVKVIRAKNINKKTIGLEIKRADVIIDGIFGTGVSEIIKEPEFTIISIINNSNSYVISNDIPSGINPDTGNPANISVKANFVIVLHKPKKWMKVHHKQKFSVINIGIPPEIDTPYDYYSF